MPAMGVVFVDEGTSTSETFYVNAAAAFCRSTPFFLVEGVSPTTTTTTTTTAEPKNKYDNYRRDEKSARFKYEFFRSWWRQLFYGGDDEEDPIEPPPPTGAGVEGRKFSRRACALRKIMTGAFLYYVIKATTT